MKINDYCFACGSRNLHDVLDLGEQPLANSYVKNKQRPESLYPLKLCYCSDCTHLQLSHTVDPREMFENYLYVSGTSNTLREYFKSFVKIVQQHTDGLAVLDIACNDGTQLDYFKQAGFKTYGIDPAKNLFEISSKNHNVICDYLNESNINSFGVKFDAIVAQNVLAHNSYPKQFLEYCKSALNKNGRIFIQTSQANMIPNGEFDTIYHEHLSFFTVKSFCKLASQSGLKVVSVFRTPVHGTSFVFVLSNDESSIDMADYFTLMEDSLTLEELKKYASNAKTIVLNLSTTLNQYKQEGYTIVGFGASAKGNTLLNFGKIKLDYIVDDNPLKQELFTPGMHIPIVHPDILSTEQKLIIVPLAWNFFDEIKQKTLVRCPQAKFVRYFPKVSVE